MIKKIMDGSPRRKTTIILLLLGIAVALLLTLYAFFWKEGKKELPSEPPPLPTLPANLPEEGTLPPPPPQLPM
jgi:hypothetical protein